MVQLYIRFRPNIEAFMEDHSGQAFFITFGLGAHDNLTITQEWVQCAQVYKDFSAYLMVNYLQVY